MKLFFVAALIAFAQSSPAQASSFVKIGQLPNDSGISIISTNYVINSKSGRVQLNADFASSQLTTYPERFKVPGLSYDDDASEIIYFDESVGRVVCAEVSVIIQPTGACRIELGQESHVVVDGDQQTTQNDVVVLFVAQ